MIAIAPTLDFTLPPELEATAPPEARGLRRDGVRLLVTQRDDDRIQHVHFADLPEILRPGDLVVANDSATLPAALTARRADGTTLALHLSTRQPDGTWAVEPRQTEAVAGEVLGLPGGGRATLIEPYEGSRRLWRAQLELPAPVIAYLYRWGRPIAYSYVRGEWPIAMYQTVFARHPGSAEMPSAGRAFSPEVLAGLRAAGVSVATITLHTGVASLEDHEPPYAEEFDVPAETAALVNETRAAGGCVIAVGTTVVRALESAADPDGNVDPAHGHTELLVTPVRGVRAVDGLLTGFHEPKATHLAMLEAFTGRGRLARAYAAALEEGYLWHEFGDLHLILP